jgi:sec-independent protein translocase protein TatB
MFGIGPVELMVVFVVALLVFGPKKLPELARTVGKGLAEFKRASNDLRRSIDLDLDAHDKPAPKGPAQTGSPQEAPEPGSRLDQYELANAPAGGAPATAGSSSSDPQPGSGPDVDASEPNSPNSPSTADSTDSAGSPNSDDTPDGDSDPSSPLDPAELSSNREAKASGD